MMATLVDNIASATSLVASRYTWAFNPKGLTPFEASEGKLDENKIRFQNPSHAATREAQ